MDIPGATTTLDDVGVVQPAPIGTPLSIPYAVRQINLTFQLAAGAGSFPGTGGSTTLTVTGLKVICHIDKVTFPQMGSTLVMKVYGLTLDQMNALSFAGLLYDLAHTGNTVLVQAGDAILGMSTVFLGQIIEAYPNLDTAEDSHFYVLATVSSLVQLKPVAPASYPGSIPAASAIQAMATQGGFNFTNNGVTAVLNSPYFPGTIWQQIQSAVRGADCFAFIDGTTNTLIIWPKNSATPPNVVFTVSPKTGMIGYPKFQKKVIIVRTLFSPQFVARPSLGILVQSSLAAANNAKLTINTVAYDLASQMPDGPWEVTIEGNPPA